MFTPRRIHKDKPIAIKLKTLSPESVLGKWDWELRGDYYYPVPKQEPMDEELQDEIEQVQSTFVVGNPPWYASPTVWIVGFALIAGLLTRLFG